MLLLLWLLLRTLSATWNWILCNMFNYLDCDSFTCNILPDESSFLPKANIASGKGWLCLGPFNVSDLPPNCNVWPPECVICDRIPWSHWVALVRSDSCTWCWLALMVPILLSILTIAIALAPTPWNQRTATSSSVGIGLKEKKNFFGLVILLLYVARQRQWQIHTYTNTQIRSAWKTHHVLYFLKAWGQGY